MAVATKINKLLGLIASRRLSQTKVAEMLGITRVSFYNKMNDPDTFKKGEIDHLMDIFGVKYEELF